MIAYIDIRTLLHSFFRQKLKFFIIFLPIVLTALVYILLATAEYESTAKLLIKFGPDARFETSPQPGVNETTSAEERRELIQSNVTILTSRDLAEALFKNVSMESVYPALASRSPSAGTIMDAMAKRLNADLVVKTENDSDIIRVSIFNPNPQVAKTVLVNLVDLFIARQSEIYSNPQTAILSEQARTAQSALEKAQNQFYAYKKQVGIVSIEEELSLLLKQRSDLNEELYSKQRFYDHYRINQTNTFHDPDIEAITKQMDSLDQKIAQTVQRKAYYDDLKREIDIEETHYKDAQQHLENAEANQLMNLQKITRISVIENPTLPYKATRPWKAMIIILSLIVGMAVGLGVCMVAEALDQRFSIPEQTETFLGIPLLGSFFYHSDETQTTSSLPRKIHDIFRTRVFR